MCQQFIGRNCRLKLIFWIFSTKISRLSVNYAGSAEQNKVTFGCFKIRKLTKIVLNSNIVIYKSIIN